MPFFFFKNLRCVSCADDIATGIILQRMYKSCLSNKGLSLSAKGSKPSGAGTVACTLMNQGVVMLICILKRVTSYVNKLAFASRRVNVEDIISSAMASIFSYGGTTPPIKATVW